MITFSQALFMTGKRSKLLTEVMGSQSKTSLLITRHPFERMVASFRDKLERPCPGHEKLAEQIVTRYRKKALEKFGKGHFSEENNFGSRLPRLKRYTHRVNEGFGW